MTANRSASASRPVPRRPPSPTSQDATITLLNGDTARPLFPGPVPVAPVQGTLALDLGGCLGMPTTPQLSVVGGDAGALDDVQAWAARFAQAVVEVLGCDRPLTQLVRWTTKPVYSDLDRRVRILGRTAPAQQRLRTVRPQVRSVHVFRPTPDTAEVSVHVSHGRRSRALAARLELDEGHWQCTALELG